MEMLARLEQLMLEGNVPGKVVYTMLGISKTYFYMWKKDGVPEDRIASVQQVITILSEAIEEERLPVDKHDLILARIEGKS